MAEKKQAPVSTRSSSNNPDERRKALDTALTQIKKQFGDGAVMRLGQQSSLKIGRAHV